MDKLIVRAAASAVDPALRDRIVEIVKAACGVRPDVEIVAMSEIYDPERSMKSRRLIDRRKSPPLQSRARSVP